MSDYIEVIAIVEGKTEQVFVEQLLAPYLAEKKIYMNATQVSKPGEKGGDVRFVRVKRDLGLHLKQRADTYVTTLIDYYGTKEWPGLETLALNLLPSQIAQHLNDAVQQEVNDLFPEQRPADRFIPFMALHEFEALLFSDAEILSSELNIAEREVTAVLEECGEPEAINNSPETAPSKRLNKWSPHEKFAKTTTGIAIAQQIGIPKMREKCPLFNTWLEQFEALVGVPA
ncbi:ATPase [Oleiphilus messinensis]|uniref:ATPase n=1 Tax=Oleiphilus messinensis TaxID=141451 RepID=A0A1Y0ICF7_9GAMM|nr:DUF4276 family protein [Oleiphilus messinensis]ARU58207.1 ATPase [Oleiphilus messinensis]